MTLVIINIFITTGAYINTICRMIKSKQFYPPVKFIDIGNTHE